LKPWAPRDLESMRSGGHRSHFGSRYISGCCDFAGLLIFMSLRCRTHRYTSPQAQLRKHTSLHISMCVILVQDPCNYFWYHSKFDRHQRYASPPPKKNMHACPFVASLRKGHSNVFCIVPNLTDANKHIYTCIVPNLIDAKNHLHFWICACHPCAGAMLIFSVSLQF
jgi:hypothetical protein